VDVLEDADERTAKLRQALVDCDTKIKNYRAALDTGGARRSSRAGSRKPSPYVMPPRR
jgi:hypothetical protein